MFLAVRSQSPESELEIQEPEDLRILNSEFYFRQSKSEVPMPP